jgi:hypothetical protein
MAKKQPNKMFIEKRGPHEYAVLRPNAKRASAIESTQRAAEHRAREIAPGAAIEPARVKHTKAGRPDQWRRADP